jgi:hypothetical protein
MFFTAESKGGSRSVISISSIRSSVASAEAFASHGPDFAERTWSEPSAGPARSPIGWDHLSIKTTRWFKKLSHVLIGNVERRLEYRIDPMSQN